MKLKLGILCIFLFSKIIFSFSIDDEKVKSIDEIKLKEIIQSRNGKILLLNIWATWCIPCREEFPDLVKLHSNYKRKVDIIGISVDDIKDIENKILPFLKENNVDFKNFVSEFKKEEQLINNLNKNWSGALPATFVFDKNGKQIKMINGKQTYLEFKYLLDSLFTK